METLENLGDAVRVDLPSHVGELRGGGPHFHRGPTSRIRSDERPGVVVDAHEVERGRDRREVTVFHHWSEMPEVLEHVDRVFPTEYGIEEPTIPSPVGETSGFAICFAVGRRVRGPRIEHDSDFSARAVSS